MEAAKAEAAEGGQAELWVFHSSRLARGSGKLNEAQALGAVFYDLRRHGVDLRSVEDDAYVTDEAFVGMASKMAHKYSEDISAHSRAGKRRAWERGDFPGGPIPDGFERVGRDLRLDPERIEVIRLIGDLSDEGWGDPSIPRELNRRGHRTKGEAPGPGAGSKTC
jgi:DNA invertase Pin-like site-specific DNA recombinase